MISYILQKTILNPGKVLLWFSKSIIVRFSSKQKKLAHAIDFPGNLRCQGVRERKEERHIFTEIGTEQYDVGNTLYRKSSIYGEYSTDQCMRERERR